MTFWVSLPLKVFTLTQPICSSTHSYKTVGSGVLTYLTDTPPGWRVYCLWVEILPCVITFTSSHHQENDGTMAGSVFCSALCLTLLLNIIRQANMTDDEEDSAAKPTEKKPFKIPSPFFCPLHKTNFCSRIKLSAVSVAPQTHSRAPKCGAGGGKWGRLDRLWVSVLIEAHGPVRMLLGMETWTFYKKSLTIFTALSSWYFSHMSLRFILLLQVWKPSVLCSAGRGAAANWSTPLCLLHK